jgi:hypothetical protein
MNMTINTSIRRWHSYIGCFMAPSVLFFALTGALQLFSLHEAHGQYQPAPIVEKLSSVHKDQVFAFGDHHAQPDAVHEVAKSEADAAPASPANDHADGDKSGIATFLLKGFFLLIALCLALSTTFGLWIGLSQPNRKRISWLLVISGTLIPLGLLIV